MFLVSCCLLCVCLLCIYLLFKNKNNGDKLHLPGPVGWPVVGNYFQMNRSRLDVTMEKWSKKYGPVYAIKIFNTSFVIATSYEAVYEILVSKGYSFSGRGKPFRRKVISYDGKDMVLGNPTEPHWILLRKIAQKIMHNFGENRTKIELLLEHVANDFVAKLRSYNGNSVDIQEDVFEFSIKAALVLIAGRKPSNDDATLELTKQFVRSLSSSIGATTGLELDCLPWLRYFGHPIFPKLLETCRLRDTLWKLFWNETQKRYASSNGCSDQNNDFFSVCMQLLDSGSSFNELQLDVEHLKGLFTNILGGSIATTTPTAYYLLNILLHHQKIYDQLEKEVEKIIGYERKPSISDRHHMPFTCAVIYELLRYTSIVTTFPHATIEDATLLGFKIPANSMVFPMFSAIHRDESFWKDPWNFRPERFLLDDGSLIPADHPNRKHLLAFGAGPRICVGELFAMKRLFIFATNIIQSFRLQFGDFEVSCDPRAFLTGVVVKTQSYVIKLVPK